MEEDLKKCSSEKLALLLQQQYQTFVQIQQNIWAINQEVKSRIKPEEITNDRNDRTGTGKVS